MAGQQVAYHQNQAPIHEQSFWHGSDVLGYFQNYFTFLREGV